MTRLLIIAFLLVFAGQASAQDIERDGRFAFIPAEEGFFRLDTRTGAVSICEEARARSICRLGADDRLAYEREITGLEDRIIALEGKVLALQTVTKLADPRAEPPAGLLEQDRTDRLGDLPSNREIDQFMDTAEHFMRRFFNFVQDLQQDPDEDTL